MMAVCAGGVVSAVQDVPSVRAEVRKVALFKNGYNWVELSATLPNAERVQISGMPQVLLGTLWWDASAGVVALEGTIRESMVPGGRCSCAGLLAANAGRNVKLSLKGNRHLVGKLIPRQTERVPEGAFLTESEEGKAEIPEFVLLQTDAGVTAVRTEDVSEVEVASGESLRVPEEKVLVPVVSALLSKPNPGASFSFGYVSNSMSWLPEYNLELGKDGTATLTARADIINEMADLNDVQLQLVSGFPAFGDALIDSPINRAVKLRELLRKLGITTMERRNALLTNQVAPCPAAQDDTFEDEDDEESEGESERGSEQVEDLFYYTLPHFTCARGQSLIREIFTEQVPYSHVYTCTVPDQNTLAHLSNHGDPIADIWHCVKLKNSGKQAWSTGIVTCTQEGNLVARSTLYFAAPGGDTLLQLNKTLQTEVLCSEELTEREERPKKGSEDNTLTVSTYTGVLTLKNNSDREMPMRLTKRVDGHVQSADENAVITVSPSYTGNPRSTVVWEFTLKPGESLKRNYTYKYEED